MASYGEIPATPEEDVEDVQAEALRDRLDVFREWLQTAIRDNWFWLAAGLIIIAAAIAWVALFLPKADVDSARWTLSALVQGIAAIFGTTFVGLTFIWNEAERSIERLRALRRGYVERLTSQRVEAVESRPEGGDRHYAINEMESYRRSMIDKMKSDQLTDDDRLLEFTVYGSHIDHLLDISALCKALPSLASLGSVGEADERRIDADLRGLGVSNKAITVDLYDSASEIKTDPFEFFDHLTNVFDILNFVPINVGERFGILLDEMSERTEQDGVPDLLRRIKRLRTLRGWFFKTTALVLIAAMASGLAILSGYEASTSSVALAVPVGLGLTGIFLVAMLIGRILATE